MLNNIYIILNLYIYIIQKNKKYNYISNYFNIPSLFIKILLFNVFLSFLFQKSIQIPSDSDIFYILKILKNYLFNFHKNLLINYKLN